MAAERVTAVAGWSSGGNRDRRHCSTVTRLELRSGSWQLPERTPRTPTAVLAAT
jgi:hypothetical protein